jgi:thioredoxin 1
MEYAGRAKFVKVDVDANERLASEYDVQSIPTVIIFRKGQALERVVGVAPATTYREKVDAAQQGRGE